MDMKNLKQKDLERFVELHIDEFHRNRLEGIIKLKLLDVMARKNPYLFKAKYLLSADAIVKTLVNAHISSSEETTFGEFLEKLAV